MIELHESPGGGIPSADRSQREHPQVTVRIAGNAFDGGRREPVAHIVAVKLAMVVSSDTAGFACGPKPAARRAIHAAIAIPVDPWRVALVERGEADAVEASETVGRGEPKITFGRLTHRADRIQRQSVVGGPMIDDHLRERPQVQAKHQANAAANRLRKY